MVPFFVPAAPHSQDATQSFCTVSLRRCMRTVLSPHLQDAMQSFCAISLRRCMQAVHVFGWLGGWFYGVPSKFRAVFVAGRVEAEVYK